MINVNAEHELKAQLSLMKDVLGDLSQISIENDDLLNEECLEMATVIKKCEEKIKNG